MTITPPDRPVARQVQLMITCLCDFFFDDVARATVEVLEHLGCEVEVPDDQTCCGQPAFNAGDWAASRRVMRHTVGVFSSDKPVIVPSGSCAAMVFHGAGLAFEDEADAAAVHALGRRTWELCDFIVNGLGVTEWPGRFPRRVSYHSSCHSRGTPTRDAALQLLGSIKGLELTEVGEGEQCCVFGGTFAVSFPVISKKMGDLKIEHLTAPEPDLIASVDMGCVLHFGGIMDRRGIGIPRLHVSQILRDSLSAESS